MSTPCSNCVGQGLIGTGAQPHLLEGRKITCPVCHGTGQEPVASATVDNGQPASTGGGILKKIFRF